MQKLASEVCGLQDKAGVADVAQAAKSGLILTNSEIGIPRLVVLLVGHVLVAS